MTTDVGHGRRRRGRRSGGKRRTPRAAIAAGALAAASFPLWPSAADAGIWNVSQGKSATQTVNVEGVSCTLEAASFRNGDFLYGRTSVSDRPECRSTLSVEVTYVALQPVTQYQFVSAFGRYPIVEVTATGARELTRSVHLAHFSGCDCDRSITLNYSSK